MVKKFIFLAISLLMFTVLGCNSKSVESTPDSIKIKGLPLETRLSEKGKVDTRIDEIRRGADKAKRIIEMFKRVQNPSYKDNVYTPIDFLIDVNNELKSQIPENQNGKLVRRGKIILPIESLSADCKVIETVLESGVLYDEGFEDQTAIGEKLTYSLKSCGSGGHYLPAIEAYWIGSTLEFKLINKNMETIFRNILLTDVMKNSVCKVTQDEKKIIESISCADFDIQLSRSEFAKINQMSFNNSGDIRFEILADIYEHKSPKANSHLQVMSNGEVKFDLNKLEFADQN